MPYENPAKFEELILTTSNKSVDDTDNNEYLNQPINHSDQDNIFFGNTLLPDDNLSRLEQTDISTISFISQVFPSFLISGLGMVLSGFVLLQAKKLPQFIPEMIMILPTLMGLKGNLEMTLASRISTEANLGRLDDNIQSMQIITANMVLVQVQAVIVAFVASLLCIILSWLSNNTIGFKQLLLVLSSSCMTASLAGLIIGIIICGIILLSHFYKFNPDNLATPIAAGLGDLTTLMVLIGACSFYDWAFEAAKWLIALLMSVHGCLFIPMFIYAYKNSWARPTLLHGWTPIFIAMIISNCTGWLLRYSSAKYKSLVLFLVVMNGTGGNIVSVQASRLCTKLGKIDTQLSLDEEQRIHTISSYLAVELAERPLTEREKLRARRNTYNEDITQLRNLLWGSSTEAKSARILIGMVIPTHIVLLTISWIFPHGRFNYSFLFVAVYLIAAIIQVTLLLILSGYLAVFTWRRGNDPDNVCVPYLTALADLFGTLSLWAVFKIVSLDSV